MGTSGRDLCLGYEFLKLLNGLAKAATATLATQQAASAGTVAQVASVAVAKPANIAAMTAEEEMAIRAWLAHIEETDADIIAEVLNQCRADVEARAYFLRRAEDERYINDDERRLPRHCEGCAPGRTIFVYY